MERTALVGYLNNLGDWKLDKYGAVSPQLRSILRTRIVRNDLKPFEKVSEPAIAKIYGVSRQPVREAFITLVNEGLLEVMPQRGTIVKPISSKEVLSGRFIREAVEKDIVSVVAEDANAPLVENLRKQIEEQKVAAVENPIKFNDLDEAFHRTLAEAAGFKVAWDFLDGIKVHMDRVRFIADGEFSLSQLIGQHTAIVDGIEKHAPIDARNAMADHLQTMLVSLPRVKRLYPEYFRD